MAGFDQTKLSLVGTGAYSKVWTYETGDAKNTVIAADYFLPVYARLNPGDIIHCRAVVGGTEVHFDVSILLSSSSTVTCLSSASRS
jgi:hypothetical protein